MWPVSMPATSSVRRWLRWVFPKPSPGRVRVRDDDHASLVWRLTLGAVSAATIGTARADAAAEPAAAVQSLYDALMAAMKDGEALGFDGRYPEARAGDPQGLRRRDHVQDPDGRLLDHATTDKKNAMLVSFDQALR